MSPGLTKTLMTIGAALAGAAMLVPQLASYREALGFLAGALTGGAHIPQPATTDQLVKRAADAVAKEEK